MTSRFPLVCARSMPLFLGLAAFAPAAMAAPAEPARPAAARPAAADPTMAPTEPARPAAVEPAQAPALSPAMSASDPTRPASSDPASARVRAKGQIAVTEALEAGEKGEGVPAAVADPRDRDRRDPPPGVAIAVPIAFFAFVLFLVAVILLIGFRKERLRHETLRLMVERGAEIPVELLTGPRKKRSSDLRRGVILIASGLGIGLFLALVDRSPGQHAWSMGLIPALIGLGYLLVWRLEGAPRDGRDEENGAPPAARAPLGPGNPSERTAGPTRDDAA